MTVEFLLTTLVVVATPGTGVLYVLAAGLARGPVWLPSCTPVRSPSRS